MRDVDVVVLSRFPEIFEGFRECVDRDAPDSYKYVVWDYETKIIPPLERPPWTSVSIGFPFQMARSANFGWGSTMMDNRDVLYAGDDTRIIEPDTISRLQALAYSDPEIGILSPRIIGHCQERQARPADSPITYAPYVAFIFVYIKREVIDAVGYMDERFEGYGVEDIDYCVRVRKAGFKIGVAKDIAVKHGVEGHSYGSTFIRVRGEKQMGEDDKANWKRFAEKWGIDPSQIGAFLENPTGS